MLDADRAGQQPVQARGQQRALTGSGRAVGHYLDPLAERLIRERHTRRLATTAPIGGGRGGHY